MHQSLMESDKFSHYCAADIGSFKLYLHEYLRDDVAKIIRTDGSWSVGSILHQEVAKTMLNNVMWWLFDGDPEQSLLHLEQLNNPQHICGKVFKSGEPTYCCRDCAMDPTCVFCQQCFWKSEHQKHRFKMHASGGGGCCDCGDVEAWHKFPSCTKHAHAQDVNNMQDAVSRLPLKIRERAPEFFEVILSYVVDFLTNEKTSICHMEESLQPSEKSDSFITMLFNDELHTFDFVIDILKKALKCDDALGADFATVVDREGRSAVCIDSKVKCEEVKNIVGMPPSPFFNYRTNEPLKTLIIHTSIVAHQEMALLILPMLTRIMNLSDGLRCIFCQVALKETITVTPALSASGSGRRSATEQLMRCDHELWKSARNHYLQLLMNSLLLDVETKKSFALLYTRLYEVMLEGFMKGDHDHCQSVTSLSVQLYTVPTIARFLIANEDAIEVILRSLLKSCYNSSDLNPDDWCKIIKLDMKKMRVALRRTYYPFHDLRYMLGILPDRMNSCLKQRIISGTKLFIQMLMAMQGMDEVVRRSNRHIERDPDWETGTTIIMKFYQIIHHLLQWIATDTEMLMTALNLCLQALDVLNKKTSDTMKRGTMVYGGKKYQCIDYDITKQAVSTQYPVSRFMAAILVELAKTGISWPEIQSNQHVNMLLDDPLIVTEMMEYSIRCLSLCAQVNAGMWRRNGLSLVNQLIFYKDYRCREEAFERDIQLLQICAANMDPSHFITLFLHKMNLINEQPEFAEHRACLLGEFFSILISVCGERFVPGVSYVTFQQQMRRQIIHILAVESKPHSKIVKYLLESVTDKPEWDETLHEVADFLQPTSTNSVGRYVLKSACLDEFCPYSYHYTSATDETKAQHEIAARKRAMQLPSVHVPPKLPRFTPLLKNVPHILCSDAFVHIISTSLHQLATGNLEMGTNRLGEKALYLIAMAITENEKQLEENPETTFNFATKSISGCENSILFLLKQLQVSELLVSHRETIRWMVAKIEKLTNQSLGSSYTDLEPTTSAMDDHIQENDTSRNTRKRKAQERRDKLLTQMKVLQQNFLSQNSELLSEQSVESSMDMSQEISMSQDIETPVCTDLLWQLHVLRLPEPSHTCILCQEETKPTEGSIVMAAFVQRSTVLTRGPRDTLSTEQYAPLFVDLSFPNGLHTSTCSHTMHYDCFKQFKESVHNSEASRRHHRFSRRSFDMSENEFLCPLCSRLSNTILPVIPRTIVAEQRGIQANKTQVVDHAAPSSLNQSVSSMKKWLTSIEEVLKPIKHEKQEIVLKFHADVSCLDDEMEKAELAGSEDSQDQLLQDTLQKLTKAPVAASADARAEEMPTFQKGVQDALDEYLQRAQTVGLNGSVSEVHRPLTSWLAVSTTMMSAEMISRLNENSILAKSPIRVSAALDGVVRTAFAMQATCTEEYLSDIRMYASELLLALVGEHTVDRSSPPLLNCNIFSIFVNLWFSTAVLRRSKLLADHPVLKDTEEFEKNLLHLCTLAQITQIFIRLDMEKLPSSESHASSADSLPDATALFQACKQIRSGLNAPAFPSSVTENQLAVVLRENLQPFVRCCALFLHHVTGVSRSLQFEEEYIGLLSYLGLPQNLSQLFDVAGTLSLEPLIQKWTTHPKVASEISMLPWYLLYPSLSQVPDIVPFPDDYSDLVGAAASFCCPKFASEDSLVPTMCLVCGVVLCSQSYCCQQPHPEKKQQVGACTFHARNCGAGAGMFLRVREATIVLLNGVHRGCFVHAPYLDKHGETDKGMRRGNPLYLNRARLLELRKLWLSHGIAEKVSHDIESRNMGHVLDWAHL